MNNSKVNFSTPETSTNSTTLSIKLMDILEISVYSFNFLFGLPTHSYVIWLIVRGPRSQVASEFFNINFTISEIGNCLTCLLSIFPICFPGVSLLGIPLFLLGFVFTSRPLFQSLICVERYLAVVHPVTFLKYKALRYRAICCAMVWIFTFGSCFGCMIAYSTNNDYAYTWFYSMELILFLSVQLFCLVAVLRTLKQSGPGERTKVEENNMKRRAFHLILIITASTVVMYVPFIMASLVTVLTQENRSLTLTSLVCFVLVSFVHPFLYLHRTVKCSCLFSS